MYYSALKQDIFAAKMSNHKTYIEIGANHPIKKNNTFLLEKEYNFKGYSVEIEKKYINDWNRSNRNNICYFEDAIETNHIKYIQENNLGKRLGYLSIDIEPPANTFSALINIIEQGLEFDCITFEHDRYQSNINFDPIVKKYLTCKGYNVAVEDVFTQKKLKSPGKKKKILTKCFLETWFVKNDIDFEKISYKDWIVKN